MYTYVDESLQWRYVIHYLTVLEKFVHETL